MSAHRRHRFHDGATGSRARPRYPQGYILPLGGKMNEVMMPVFGLVALLANFGVMVAAVVGGLYIYDRFVKKR